jgi:hypothetical protein
VENLVNCPVNNIGDNDVAAPHAKRPTQQEPGRPFEYSASTRNTSGCNNLNGDRDRHLGVKRRSDHMLARRLDLLRDVNLSSIDDD